MTGNSQFEGFPRVSLKDCVGDLRYSAFFKISNSMRKAE